MTERSLKAIKLVKNARPLLFNEADAQCVTVKGRADYVTRVDLQVQEYFREALLREFPDSQLLAEEGDHAALDWSRPVWILDPVDGTTNLIHDRRESCVSLGLWDGQRPVFGCVWNPFRDELFCAERGEGAFLNGKPIHVSDRDSCERSLFLAGTTPYEKERSHEIFELLRRLFVAGEDIRRSGSAALDLCGIACGRAEGYVEYNLKPWDFAAGLVILEEAGGTVTSPDGSPLFVGKNADVIATNGRIHEELLQLVRG